MILNLSYLPITLDTDHDIWRIGDIEKTPKKFVPNSIFERYSKKQPPYTELTVAHFSGRHVHESLDNWNNSVKKAKKIKSLKVGGVEVDRILDEMDNKISEVNPLNSIYDVIKKNYGEWDAGKALEPVPNSYNSGDGHIKPDGFVDAKAYFFAPPLILEKNEISFCLEPGLSITFVKDTKDTEITIEKLVQMPIGQPSAYVLVENNSSIQEPLLRDIFDVLARKKQESFQNGKYGGLQFKGLKINDRFVEHRGPELKELYAPGSLVIGKSVSGINEEETFESVAKETKDSMDELESIGLKCTPVSFSRRKSKFIYNN